MAHHIFCNKFMAPEEGCEMCKGLREKYPEDLPPDELVAKYFPSVKVRHLTPRAPDAGDSVASTGNLQAQTESASEGNA